MNTYSIKDFELKTATTVKAQGVAEAVFDYLPWPSFNSTITFKSNNGWTVVDNMTGFKYEVTAI